MWMKKTLKYMKYEHSSHGAIKLFVLFQSTWKYVYKLSQSNICFWFAGAFINRSGLLIDTKLQFD